MREILADDTMQIALLALIDSNRPKKVKDDAEAIASVRCHSRAGGYDDAISELLSMRDMISAPLPEEETDYTTRP